MDKIRPDYQLVSRTETIVDTIDILQKSDIELILLDINLADGSSFEIFNQIEVHTPIIFTTAYDEYAIQAFKLNSIDYLLKPIAEAELLGALEKFERSYNSSDLKEQSVYKNLDRAIFRKSKNRFLIQHQSQFMYIETKDISFFYSEEKVVFLHTFDNKRYIVNYTLDELMSRLKEEEYYRVSRNCIANIRAIKQMNKIESNRLELILEPSCPTEVIVSRARVMDFLDWIDDK